MMIQIETHEAFESKLATRLFFDSRIDKDVNGWNTRNMRKLRDSNGWSTWECRESDGWNTRNW